MNTKFTIAEIFFLLLLTSSLFAQNYNYISDYDSQGVPLDMVNTPVSQSLQDNINASLPENYPVPEYNPEYIADGVETNVKLTELADVWVTFVGEGAGYKNVLGYYSYDAFNPPTSPPADEDITIIFPNVSAAGSGGGLLVGDKMHLGQFPANTEIGWVLIANGWNGNQVTYGNWVLYSNPYWNPEGSAELQKHNVNLYDDNEQVVVFGFEDIRRDYSSCDQDFNDALFLVTSNPYNAIETNNFNPISTDGGGQSSGNDGGLESHRGISSAIANRTFKRNKTRRVKTDKSMHIRSNTVLSELAPTSIKAGDKRSISSPSDLVSITKADHVWSADYTLEGVRFATIFATETQDGIYDHTKVVCDRLAGSEIIDIKEISILGHPLLLTSLKTRTNSIEYSISFSLGIDDNSYSVLSKWAIDQYLQEGHHLNYQVWSSAPFTTKDIVKQIIQNINQTHIPQSSLEPQSYLPDVYIKSGEYKENSIELMIMNPEQETAQVNIFGTLSTSEIDQNLEPYFETVAVPHGEHRFVIENIDNELFDVELKIQKEESIQYDVAYFSDGAWGLDYDKNSTTIHDLEIENNPLAENENYTISRNLSVAFTSTDYLSVFKHLKPSGSTVDLSEYNTLSFDGSFTKPIQVRIIKESIENWKDQYTYVVNPNNASRSTDIPFSHFRNPSKQQLDLSDVTMIVFTQTTNTGMDNQLEFMNVHFTNQTNDIALEHNTLTLTPNPSFGSTKITFESDVEENGKIILYDMLGKSIQEEHIHIHQGLNVFHKDFRPSTKGIYLLSIEGSSKNTLSQKLILH